MTEREAFVTRLRRRRERNRMPLEEIAQDTRVKLELLQELERDDLSNWPRGLYARAYIRAYAAAIGLDGNEAVDEFCRLFPQGDRRTEPVIREMAAIVASQAEYRYDYRYATEVDRRRSADAVMLPKTRTETAIAAVGRAGRVIMSLVSGFGSRSQTASPRS